MQLERAKQVGKKKVVVIVTALMLTVGGVGASASQTVQDSVKTAIDNMFKTAVDYYVSNVDAELNAYAEEQKGTIPGTVAHAALSYMEGMKNHYNNAMNDAKKRISTNTSESIQAQLNYGNNKYSESVNAIYDKINAKVAEENAEMDAFIANEFSKINGTPSK